MPLPPGFPREPLPECQMERDALARLDAIGLRWTDHRATFCGATHPALYCCTREPGHDGAHLSAYAPSFVRWSPPVLVRWI